MKRAGTEPEPDEPEPDELEPPPVAPPPVAPPVVPPVVPPPGVPPIGPAEVDPAADPTGSVALARTLIAEEGTKGWKRISPEVLAWQKANGLPADGKFGPRSALFMGQYVGILPTIRYWSGWDKQAELQKYWASLADLASTLDGTNPAHAAGLRVSAAHENGEGWPASGVQAINPASRVAQAAGLGTAFRVAEATGEALAKVIAKRLAEIRDAIQRGKVGS
jgi:hypothetical protein